MALPQDPLIERYPVRIRCISAGVVLTSALLLFMFPRFMENGEAAALTIPEVVETIAIPPTEQFEVPPPPARPSIPVESESEDIAEDITIEETDLESFIEWDSPPPPPAEGPRVLFIAYDEAPEPIGGQAAMLRRLVYPQIAVEAGLEGTVWVRAFVDKNGRVTETMIIKGFPQTGLDEAAMEAVRKTPFKPARQRDIPLGVWISIPIRFQLSD